MKETIDCTPPELATIAAAATEVLIPKKSKEKYEQQYELYFQWKLARVARPPGRLDQLCSMCLRFYNLSMIVAHQRV